MLTALGVPGGTAAKTFDDAYLDELSKSNIKWKILKYFKGKLNKSEIF